MKLQISFDKPDLDKALEIAQKIEPYATILEIGTLLLYKYGIKALEEFRSAFPDKEISVDTKIIDRAKESVLLFSEANVSWLSVMAGTTNNIIHSAGTTAHNNDIKIMLDLLDSSSLGQTALEAQSLEADAILLHRPYDEENALVFLDQWGMVRGNTSLPIFVSGKITREIIDKVVAIKPDGIIIGKAIVEAEDPTEEAKFFYNTMNPSESKSQTQSEEK